MNNVPLKQAINASQQINKLAAELNAFIRAAAEIGIAVQVDVNDELRVGYEFATPIITATARIDPTRLEVPAEVPANPAAQVDPATVPPPGPIVRNIIGDQSKQRPHPQAY